MVEHKLTAEQLKRKRHCNSCVSYNPEFAYINTERCKLNQFNVLRETGKCELKVKRECKTCYSFELCDKNFDFLHHICDQHKTRVEANSQAEILKGLVKQHRLFNKILDIIFEHTKDKYILRKLVRALIDEILSDKHEM